MVAIIQEKTIRFYLFWITLFLIFYINEDKVDIKSDEVVMDLFNQNCRMF